MRTGYHHYHTLWQSLGSVGKSDDVYQDLIARYYEPQRGYHTVQHLNECLIGFDKAKDQGAIRSPNAVEMALWFHDAVYDPRAPDNEEQSAALASRVLNKAGIPAHLIAEIERLILATKAHAGIPGDDSEWIIDIDLAILGASPSRFAEYENQIWHEYSWVPTEVYRQKRAEVLQHFLDRTPLFATPLFQSQLEANARLNLAQLIKILRAQ